MAWALLSLPAVFLILALALALGKAARRGDAIWGAHRSTMRVKMEKGKRYE